jgi:hypothetical protein
MGHGTRIVRLSASTGKLEGVTSLALLAVFLFVVGSAVGRVQCFRGFVPDSAWSGRRSWVLGYSAKGSWVAPEAISQG